MKSYLINLFTTVVIIVLAYVFLHNSQIAKQELSNQDGLTVEDIAEFHEMNYWIIKLPQKCQEGFIIKFYSQIGKDKPITFGAFGHSSKNIESYSKMKLIVSCQGNYKYKVHVIKGGITFNFSPLKYDLKPKTVTWVPNGSEIQPKQIFMKFSSKNSISNSQILQENECGLFYTIEPYKMPQNQNTADK